MTSALSPLIHFVQYTISEQAGDTPFIDGLKVARTELTGRSVSEKCIDDVFEFLIDSMNKKAILRRGIRVQKED